MRPRISILIASLILTQGADQATSSSTSLKATWDKIASKQSQSSPATSLGSSDALISTTLIPGATQVTQKNRTISSFSSSSTIQNSLSAHEASLSTEKSTTALKDTSTAADTSTSTAAKTQTQTISLPQTRTIATTALTSYLSTLRTRLSSLVDRKQSTKPITRAKPTTSILKIPPTKTEIKTSRFFIPKTNPTSRSFNIHATTPNHQRDSKTFGKWEIFGFCCLGVVVVMSIFGIVICSVRFRSNHKAEKSIRMRVRNAQMHHQKHGHRPFTVLPSSGTNEPPKIKENPYEMIGIIRSARSDDSLRIMEEMDLNTRSKDSNKTLGDSASNTLDSLSRSVKPPPPDQISPLKEENAPVFSVSERSSSLMEASSPESFSPDGEDKYPAGSKDKRKPDKLSQQQRKQSIKEKHRPNTDRAAPKHTTRIKVNQPNRMTDKKTAAVPLFYSPVSPPVRSPYSPPVRRPDSPTKGAGLKLEPLPTTNIRKTSANFNEKPSKTKTSVEPKEISVDETSEESSWSAEDRNEKY